MFLQLPDSLAMAQEMEKSRITEVQVRMDCNGCVQKVKKALHSISGIQEIYIDLPQQKIMIIGWAEPEKIVKAIKKTRKSAIICSQMEPEDSPAQPAKTASDDARIIAPKASAASPIEPPNNQVQPSQPHLENLPPENNLSLEERQSSDTDIAASLPPESPRPRDVKEVHMIYHYPTDYRYRYAYDQSHTYGHSFSASTSTNPRVAVVGPEQPSLQYATHKYNTSRAAPEYATISYNNYRPEPPSPQYATQHYKTYRPEPPPPQYVTHNYNAYRAEPYPPQYVTSYRTYRPESTLRQYVISNDNASRPEPPPRQYATSNANRSEPPMLENETQNHNVSLSQPPPPLYVTHNWNTYRPEAHPIMNTNLNQNTYRPSPCVTPQYEYIRPPPQYSHYSREKPHSEDISYYYGNNITVGNIGSVFSDENPNSCTIV